MRTLLSYTSTNLLTLGRIEACVFMNTTFVNGILCGTPYTWDMGFGFEEVENGNPVKMYSAYYDGDKIVAINISRSSVIAINMSRSSVVDIKYGMGDDYLIKNLRTPYHSRIIKKTQQKYKDVYKDRGVKWTRSCML